MRDKLIELLKSATSRAYWNAGDTPFMSKIADHLIANGVTVQEWIPVSKMLPTYTSDYLVYLVRPFEGKLVPLGRSIAAYIARDDCWDLPDPYIVTHWMPLPEAPKEVE